MATKQSEETLDQKEKRLKRRKPVMTGTFRKGLYLVDKEKLIKWIQQDDVLIRAHKGGRLDDDTEFMNITIEGIKA